MSDSGAVDAAILAALRADGALLAAAPGGVCYAIAPPDVVNFVIVDRLDQADDDAAYGEAAGEIYTYLAKAVIASTSSDQARTAARRIRAVLLGAWLTPDGYRQQRPIEETGAIRSVEVDPANTDRRIQHWGGQYVITVQATGGEAYAVSR